MFTNYDIEFDEMAADSVRRHAMITSLSKRRAALFWIAMLMMALAFVASWFGSGVIEVLGFALICSIYFKMESDLRLLRAIELLQKNGDAKPTV
jgi:hypothetical protein